MVTVDAPDVAGDEHERVVLDAPDDPLSAALAGTLEPPYRLRAVRRDAQRWAVAGRRIRVVRLPGVRGEELSLTVARGSATLEVDGLPTAGGLDEILAAVPVEHDAYALSARRLDAERWEVDVLPL